MTLTTVIAMVGLAAFLILIFYLIIPFSLLIGCLTATHLSSKAKTIFTILMFFFWPIPQYLYGLFSSEKKALNLWLSFLGLASFLGTISIGIYLGYQITHLSPQAMDSLLSQLDHKMPQIAGMPEVNQGPLARVSHLVEIVDEVANSELSRSKRDQMQLSLGTLQLELQEEPLPPGKQKVLTSLIVLLEHFTEDQDLSEAEYESWQKHFKNRQNLDPQVFSAQIRETYQISSSY